MNEVPKSPVFARNIALLFYYAFLAFAMWYPLRTIVSVSSRQANITHFALFFGLYAVVYYNRKFSFDFRFFLVALASTVFFEAGQIFLPYRQFDFFDILVNLSGVIAGLLIITLLAFLHGKLARCCQSA